MLFDKVLTMLLCGLILDVQNKFTQEIEMNIYLVIASVSGNEIFREEIAALSPEHAEICADHEIYENDPYHNPYLANSGIEYNITFVGRESE